MRSRLSIFAIAIASMLSSCSRHEAALTGSYGERVVSGRVVLASEMANTSPTGVQVEVVGTRMCATLAADGRFMFVGVPAGAELTFRRADGIDARLRAETLSAAPRVIELSRAMQTVIKVRGTKRT